MNGIKYTIMLTYTMTILLEYIDCLLVFPQMLNITLPYYAGIVLNAFNDPSIMLKIMLA